MAEVIVKNLSKRFGKVEAVKNLSFRVEDKEFVILIGPSGCGKSTTLNLIAGLEDIEEGQIFIGNKLVNDLLPKERDIAMVFQNYALYPHMNVYENMAFGLKMRRFKKIDIDKRVKEAAIILGIEDLLKRKPKQLSGGQRQRVALGRAIVRKPDVFLFDEPLSNLDAKLRVQMRAELSKLHEKLKTTIIYVTHDQTEAMTMGTKIVVLKDGISQQIASPMELYNFPVNEFVASFIGNPPMNIVSAKIKSRNSDLFVDTGCFEILIPDSKRGFFSNFKNKNIRFGIRPEDIKNTKFSKNRSRKNIIIMEVDIIEPLGAQIQLTLKKGENQLVAMVDQRTNVKIHDKIEVEINMEKAHFFEANYPNLRIKCES
jgi:multiple sugar transport system ATP-binding protein